MATKNWNASMQFPADSDYTCRITEAVYGPSKSSGKKMITLTTEVISPEEREIAGQMVNIAGTKCTNYYSCEGDNELETKEAQARVFGPSNDPDAPSLYERLQLDGSKVDLENPDMKVLVGLCVLTQMGSEVSEERKTPTAEQIAKAKEAKTRPQGDIQKHPITGKPLVKYWPRLKEIFGVAPAGAGSNKPY